MWKGAATLRYTGFFAALLVFCACGPVLAEHLTPLVPMYYEAVVPTEAPGSAALAYKGAAEPPQPGQSLPQSGAVGDVNGVLAMPAVPPAATPVTPPRQETICANTPADWLPYRVQRGDNLYRIAVSYGSTIAALARANCIADPQLLHVGQTVFVPPERYVPGDLPPLGGSAALPESGAIGGGGVGDSLQPPGALPIAITYFAASTALLDPGQTVRLTWVTQGPVSSVQIGWLHQGIVLAAHSGLPASGAVDVQVPADGRRTMPFVLQVSDGETVASAFATVQVNCIAQWFFQPAPADVCPYPALSVQVEAQQFERGLVMYLPGLDRLYVLFDDETWAAFSDGYRPGMPYRDVALALPENRIQPEGAIGYLWRVEAGLAERLGWALQPGVVYIGTVQRAVYPDHDQVYITAPSGALYVLPQALSWQFLSAAPPGQAQ